MSLAAIFTGPGTQSEGKHVDEGLDAIFKSSAGPSSYIRTLEITSAEPSSSGLLNEGNLYKDKSLSHASKKRKAIEASESSEEKKKKKNIPINEFTAVEESSSIPDDKLLAENVSKVRKKKSSRKDVQDSAGTNDTVDDPIAIRGSKKTKMGDSKRLKSINTELEENSISPASPTINQVENGDASTKLKRKSKTRKGNEQGSTGKLDSEETLPPNEKKQVDPDSSDSESSDQLGPLPVHESVAANAQSGPSKLTRKIYIPEDETVEQRNARTIFVGNLPIEAAKSKSLLKQLKRHFITAVPTKIEAVRFRSVAFKTPTSRLDSDGLPVEPESPSAKKHRQQMRAATWRDEQDKSEDKTAEKRYLTSEEKRRIAFITGDFHDKADSVNAYIVFAHPLPDSLQPQNLPKKSVMNPYEAAKLAVKLCNGTKFLDRTIRVDLAKRDDESMNGDARLTVFVGNLDFATKEEDLRVFFEALVTTEKGPPPENLSRNPLEIEREQQETSAQKQTGLLKSPKWVTSVRVIRDRNTQLGKGFAYVQFANRECVDEIIAMDPDSLKFAKRKLRVQRCKTIPGQRTENDKTKSTDPAKLSPNKTSSKQLDRKERETVFRNPSMSTKIPEVPKGNPFLGQKLVGLSKEMRKQVKANDKDRLARRLAKKKARAALAHANTGMKESKSLVRSGDDKKERVRQRKPMKGKELNIGKKKGKGRVRSDKALSKMNVKKS